MSGNAKKSRCDGCMDVGVINCMWCIAGAGRVSAGTTGSEGGCRNAEMSSRIAALKVRVENIEIIAGRPLVGPTEWAEAVSLARFDLDRVGVAGGAVKPDYILGTVGRDLAGILASLVRELSAQGFAVGGSAGKDTEGSAAMTEGLRVALSVASKALKGLEALHVL